MIKTPNQEQGVSYIGSLIATVAAWDLNTWIAVLGFLMGFVTFLTGRYYQRRREARDKRLFELEEKIKETELAGFVRRRIRQENKK
jgi:hypothetical protein